MGCGWLRAAGIISGIFAEESEGTDFTLLDAEDMLLSQILHLAMHRYHGQLKWAVDVAAATDHFGGQISWPMLWERAERLGACRVLAFGLWLCGQVLDEPGLGVQPRHELRWHLLRRLTPLDALVQPHAQPARWRRALTDLALPDGLRDGLRALRESTRAQMDPARRQ